jgi:hypothetical protein
MESWKGFVIGKCEGSFGRNMEEAVDAVIAPFRDIITESPRRLGGAQTIPSAICTQRGGSTRVGHNAIVTAYKRMTCTLAMVMGAGSCRQS